MRRIETESDLDDLSRSVRAWLVLCSWSTTGLLDILADGRPRAADELPIDGRSFAITAPVLGHLGLLVRHPRPGGDAWALSRTGRRLHAEGCLNLGRGMQALDDLLRLESVMVEGGPVKDRSGKSRSSTGGVRADDPDGTRAFMDMLYRRSAHSCADTAAFMADLLPPSTHVLDLGGGHGRYSEELLDKGCRATLFDQSICVQLARERYGDRMQYQTGDFMVDELGGPYGAALLSNIVHGMSPEEIPALLGRLADVIAPGGLLVIKDMFIDDTGVGPEVGVVFGLMMLMYTEGGQSYAVPTMTEWLQAAGFGAVNHVQFTDQSFSLVTARRMD